MPQLTFLLDENISHKTLARLRRTGLNVESLKTQKRLGIANGDLLKLVNKENWVLITHDSDFLNLRFKPENGIIIVKIHPAIDEISGRILEKFLKDVDSEIFRRKVIILEKEGYHFLKD